MFRAAPALLLAVLLTASAATNAQPVPALRTADGTLTTAAGMTLYVFDRDVGGKSACSGPCAANWPPLLVFGDGRATGDWTIIVREDGSKQWAYKGKPLYTCAKDTRAGDKMGDGINNLWHVAKAG